MGQDERVRRRARLADRVRTLLRGTRVYALVGKSGDRKELPG